MNASRRPAFHYHADANPIGGRITAPVKQLLPPEGSASLAQAGGHSSGRLGPHRIDGILSFDCAHSEVFGYEDPAEASWVTTVSSVVEGLNILDIVRADAAVAKIKTRHPHKGGPPSVSFGGTHFYNLTVEGRPIKPIFDLDTFARSRDQAAKHGGHWEKDPFHLGAAMKHVERMLAEKEKDAPVPQWIRDRYDWMIDAEKQSKRGHAVCSLVREIPDMPKGSAYGHILHVPDVGNLFLGEIYVSSGMFRVTLLRAELGCQAEGDFSVGSAGSNGNGTGGSGMG